MQVKKFEARTMKEALEMVKKHLGPEAIILGARDNRKSFGLVGEGSVEVTAAISDEILQKKKFTESRMRPEDREKFQSSPARVQKQVMENFVNKFNEDQRGPSRPVTRTRYIEIDDPNEEDFDMGQVVATPAQARIKNAAQRAWNEMQNGVAFFEDEAAESRNRKKPLAAKPAGRPPAAPGAPGAQENSRSPGSLNARIAAAAGKYRGTPVTAAGGTSAGVEMHAAGSTSREAVAMDYKNSEILALKSELAGLKEVLSQFQKVPQNVVTAHPGADFGLSYEFSSTFEKLTQSGVTEEITAEILGIAQTQMPPVRFKNKALVDAWTARYLLDSTRICDQKPASKVQIFVGPSGAGKTSSMVKLAAHAAVSEGKRVVLLTADTFKVGAADQMRIYANILNVPFAVVRRASDWPYLISQLANYDLILCDFPGMSLKTMDEISMLKSLMPSDHIQKDVHLVLSATAKNQDLYEFGKRFKPTGFTDLIFTKLDDSNQHGTLYNLMRQFDVPLHSFGTGSRVPEDFEMATKERVLDLIFKLTKMKKAE